MGRKTTLKNRHSSKTCDVLVGLLMLESTVFQKFQLQDEVIQWVSAKQNRKSRFKERY